MDVFIKETGYFYFNQMVDNRMKITLPNEKHFYEYKKNLFHLNLEKVENDFMVKPVFCCNDDVFIEKWLLYPYNVDSEVESAMIIQSEPINNIEDLIHILNVYGFEYTGRFNSYYHIEDLKSNITEYFWQYFSSYSHYKVNFFFDQNNNCLTIQNFYQTGSGIKVYFIEGGYWFIPCMPEENSFISDLCKTVRFLLSQYELISIFGQKK